jgi:hypothetical protein
MEKTHSVLENSAVEHDGEIGRKRKEKEKVNAKERRNTRKK